ncbi:hypothetical protein [Paratractidigestivibacter sp.]|uniref:hypothetical protein n=1 Tax=Paratractidigestivibacter sp. TaxID=2847316 RepID=UPI002ABDADC7|nr:hypothetical protein [Paratractidigestivibacter sp.]
MSDVRPSIPRTPAQATLRVVSIVMAIIGGVVVVGGVLAFWYRDRLGLADELSWLAYSYGGIILGVAALLLVTAWLGLRAADDSSRVAPYRNLCYSVGLVTLVAIVWGWGMGTFLLFNPFVLLSTVTYVLVCSQLADKVAEEHERGVSGEVFLLNADQRTLHLLSEVILVKGALIGTFTGVMAIGLLAQGGRQLAEQLGVAMADYERALITYGVTAAINIGVAMLGIWGSNRPQRVTPFLVISGLVSLADAAFVVIGVVMHQELGTAAVEILLDLVYMGACTWQAWKIRRQA